MSVCVCVSPVVSSLDAVQADRAVGPEQNHHVTKHVQQQCVGVKFGDASKRVIQISRTHVQPQLKP